MLNPALIGVGTAYEVIVTFGSAMLGIVLISSGLQGYLYWVGTMGNSLYGWVGRTLLVVGGIILALPGNSPIVGYSHLELNATATVVAILGIAASWLSRRDAPPVATA